MTEMFGEAWSPMSVPDLAPDDDDEYFGLPVRINDAVFAHDKLSDKLIDNIIN